MNDLLRSEREAVFAADQDAVLLPKPFSSLHGVFGFLRGELNHSEHRKLIDS
jgi:hypothetical protein